MLFILIPVAWLAIVIPLVACCLSAARADAAPTGTGHGFPRSVGAGLVLWEDPPAPALAARWAGQRAVRRREARPPLRHWSTALRKRQVAAHGIRHGIR